MEKGSFQKSQNALHFSETNKFRAHDFIEDTVNHDTRPMSEADEVSRIPIPTAIPQTIDMDRLPPHILRSATVDTLLHQNEDLMARLKLQLRRNADLENQVQNLRDGSSDIIDEIDRLRDELLIYKEKERLLAARSTTSHSEIEGLRNKIKFLETQYAELYSVSQERRHQLLAKTRQISRFEKYRRALGRVAREMRAKLRSSEEENQKQVAVNRDLMSKLGEAGEHIQNISRRAKEDQAHLVATYERQLDDSREYLEQAQKEISSLRTVHEQNEALLDERIEWNNERVRMERSLQAERESHVKQVRELQEALASYRQDSKERALQMVSLEKERDNLLEEKANFKVEQQALIEQVESLQVLWRDNQNQIDKLNSQVESLQKLNQQLSQQINQYRKENTDLRNQSESSNFRASERIRELTSQVQLMSEKKYKSLQEQEALANIQNLLVEIQSGFQVSGSAAQDNPSSDS